MSEIQVKTGKSTIDLFINANEYISIINFKVSKNSLNLTLSNPLACSIITQSKSPSGELTSKFLVNFDHPTYLEEEIKTIENLDQTVILVCYRSDSLSKRLLESQIRKDSVEIEYISRPVEKPETTVETTISFEEPNNDDNSNESHTGKIFLIFLFAFIFILIIGAILFFVKKLNKTLKSKRKKLNKTSNQNIASYPEINNHEEITSNPYQNYQKYITIFS